MFRLALLSILAILYSNSAHAEFIVTSAIVEFNAKTPPQQDIEIVSRSDKSDYVVVEVSEILSPGTTNEQRRVIDDPTNSHLLVTPNKTVLSAGGRKTLRFVLLKPLDNEEHIYRVAIKPVIKGVDNTAIIGLKILIGYEVLVIIRPAEIKSSYSAKRDGMVFTATNTGNTNVLFQNGQQCTDVSNCVLPSVLRIYPGETGSVDLKYDAETSYSVWDGVESVDKKF